MKYTLNRILFSLLCAYAFLIPFEHILKFFFGIDTILKPYRVVALLLVFLAAFTITSKKIKLNADFKQDLFLYLLFVYAIFITLFRMAFDKFDLSWFINDTFQFTIYLSIFVVIKFLDINVRQWYILIWSLVLGITVNAISPFNTYYIVGEFFRDPGFMDNPNYMALGLVIAISFLIMQLEVGANLFRKAIIGFVIVFLVLVFLGAGSRTAVFIMAATITVMFVFGTGRTAILVTGILAFFYYVNTGSVEDDLGAAKNATTIQRMRTLDTGDDPRVPLCGKVELKQLPKLTF